MKFKDLNLNESRIVAMSFKSARSHVVLCAKELEHIVALHRTKVMEKGFKINKVVFYINKKEKNNEI